MMNQVGIVGRLTKEPDLRLVSDGRSVANITVAVNRQFRNQNGEVETDFIQCTLWHKSAENLVQYCTKGSLISVAGRLQSRSYEKDGKRKYVMEVIVEQVRFLDNRKKEKQQREEMNPDDSRTKSDGNTHRESYQNAW
ncbi:single-stranded DNA-binding protein [Cytobacillus kochii]|uniref:single-stranded DNA-binding protein n=2 Tax=Bacillaceae TaxID=186817 RepID=UPI001CD3C168|nr:single-stranded DNA-binding protein [Cytobacillus kochii]MCA1026318.1 single-stranded DNA-binding protein [Cytobacillus kochii]MCM3322536.1 single-stranded DNA-binding protein [Cytobacillus kochii]MCM3344986.1 single-stranded DNA-binding protein [Cytobacillus kochii]MDM5209541.1 single-stranded DNA-binding protein [Cytobacillus kochii]